MSTRLHSETIIDASAERVWQILTEFDAYPGWNPFIRRISGTPDVGKRLEVHLVPPGSWGMTLRPIVLAAQPNRELCWLGHLGVRGLFDGMHVLQIEPVGPNRVRFIQGERFAGVLAPLIFRFIEDSTRQGFAAMNQALKERAENVAALAA